MRLRTSALLGLLVTTVGGLALEACRSPTQVTLDIRTDVPCSSLRRGRDRRERGAACGRAARQLELLSPRPRRCVIGGRSARSSSRPATRARGAVIVIAGIDRPAAQCNAEQGYFGCIVARRSFAFVDHTPLTLRSALTPTARTSPAMRSRPAPRASASSSEVACCGAGCEEPTADGGIDASTSDAPSTIDAPIDAPRTDSGDAAPDAPVGSPLVCTQGSGATVACNAPTGACCYSNDVVTASRTAGPADGRSTGASAARTVALDSKCCSVDVYTGASDRLNTQCQAGGCGRPTRSANKTGNARAGRPASRSPRSKSPVSSARDGAFHDFTAAVKNRPARG